MRFRERVSAGMCVILTVALTAGLAVGSTPAAPSVASPVSEDLLYVCNQDDATVDVVDIGTLSVVRTVRLQEHGFGPNAKPHHVVVEPDGSAWYVSLIGENRVVKIDAGDRLLGQVSSETPGMLALHPTQDLLLVGRSMTAVNPPQRIGAIVRSTMQESDELDVFFPRPHALAVGDGTGIAYTASLAENRMAAVDPADETVELLAVEGPQHALMQFAIAPDGGTVVASAELSHRLLVFDLADPMSPTLIHSIEVGAQPFDPLFTRDGRWVYVPNKAANTVTVIDAVDWSIAAVIEQPGLIQPHGTVNSPDGRYLFVSSNNVAGGAHDMHGMAPAAAAEPAGVQPDQDAGHDGHDAPRRGTVTVFDAATHEVVKVIQVGRNATGMGARRS